jgi:hypothetical protein
MKLLDVIQNWTWTDVFIGWFVGFIIHQELNIAYKIKKLIKVHPTRYIKLIDCYPCFTFWTSLIVTQSLVASIVAFFLATYLDKK